MLIVIPQELLVIQIVSSWSWIHFAETRILDETDRSFCFVFSLWMEEGWEGSKLIIHRLTKKGGLKKLSPLNLRARGVSILELKKKLKSFKLRLKRIWNYAYSATHQIQNFLRKGDISCLKGQILPPPDIIYIIF